MSALLMNVQACEGIDPAVHVNKLMRQRIERYLDTRSDPSLYQSIRNMSQFVSDDYGNRFLIELIQNAHDAHDPSCSDGEIVIVLDATEDTHGCLYVANRGNGFTSQNLNAIINIALSSKPANAGIGNKGLGFRSVLQVCNWPEIYSVQGIGGNGTFDGYCFRFATVDDLAEALDPGAAELAQEMAENLPCWHVPVPARPGPNITQFAIDGFATVVRLPLKSNDALHTVQKQIDLLISQKTPLHLFLNRVGQISIDPGGGRNHVSLCRAVSNTWNHQSPDFALHPLITIARVHLGDEEYAVVHCEVEEKIFRAALQASLDKGEVPESWKHWEGNARVSVAVPLGAPLDSGRLYCFLPLGSEGKAPLAGYINANFYTKMDRRTVDTSIRLNDLFMRMAVWASCQLIGFLIKKGWPESPSAVVSLLCWDDAYVEMLKHGLGDNGQGILVRKLLPVHGAGETVAWASPKETYGWIAPAEACLSPRRICEVGGAKILVDTLTATQRAGLDRLYLRLRDTDFKPPAPLVAEWVERIAGKLHEEAAAPTLWALFYDEVAMALATQAAVLFGKRFLLSASGELISSELPIAANSGRARRAADVYFAPVMSVDADVDDEESKHSLPLENLPTTLRRGFALLSREVPWLKDDGGYRPGRTFLISGKLAREYDTRDVLRTLASVTRSADADSTRVQALEWAFRLWNSGRSLSDKETRAATFFVPCADKWISAEAAMFGSGWEVDNGKKLQTLLRLGATHSAELRQSLLRLLPEFSAWPIKYGSRDDWVRFLHAAGVTDCLRPIGGEKVALERSGTPFSLVVAVSSAVADIADPLRAHWRTQLTQDCKKMFTSRSYRAEIKPWRVPGQGDLEEFPHDVRYDYAVQVAYAMRNFTEEHQSFRAVRADAGAASTEQHRLATPLFAFLTGGEWVPVQRSGGAVHFVKANRAWHFNGENERPPRFMEFLAHQVAAVTDPATFQWLRGHAQLGLFNDDRDAERALLAMAAAAVTRITDVRDVRRYRDIFRRLWEKARESGQPAPGMCVPVMMAGSITCVGKGVSDIAPAYFDDERDALKAQLLGEVGEPVFDFVHGDQEATWHWINSSAPGCFQHISDEPAEVYVDGIKFDDTMQTYGLAAVVGSWIIDFFVCVAEHKGSSFVQATPNTLGRIRRAALGMVVVTGGKIQIAHGENRIPLPPSLRGALSLNRPSGPVLIVQTPSKSLSLNLLAGAAGQLAVALGSRELANGLEASLLRLVSMLNDNGEEVPDDIMVASALGVDVNALKRTRRLATADLFSLLDFAVPLSACLATQETTSRLQELASSDAPTHEDIQTALTTLAAELNLSFAQLEERMAGLVDLRDLKLEFELPIAHLNAIIVVLGGRYKPITNEHLHREAWSRHLRQRQPATMKQLRERLSGAFDRGDSLAQYAFVREKMLSVAPDAAWFTVYDELPDVVMDAHLTQWLDEQVLHDPAATPLELSLDQCRTLNGERLRKFLDTFAPILSAWVRIFGTLTSPEVRRIWTDPVAAREAFFKNARDGGWLDFRLLDDEAIALWLTRAGIWPVGRTASHDLATWSLSVSDLSSNEDQAKLERAEVQRRRSQVEFGGTMLSALKTDYADIASAVAASLAQATSLQKVTPTDSPLETIPPARPSSGSGNGSGKGVLKSPESGMSDEQKMAVGLIGELWAREWIRQRHQLDVVNDSVWVSCYSDAVLNSSSGSDGWGYDFIVATKSRTYYYEVKASTGDPRRFEMGPTEIGAAQRYKSDREHRYRILYLAYVGDPARMTLTLLANPFSSKAEGKFRAVGKGSVTYEFVLAK
jgi:hypothetical protein